MEPPLDALFFQIHFVGSRFKATDGPLRKTAIKMPVTLPDPDRKHGHDIRFTTFGLLMPVYDATRQRDRNSVHIIISE